MGTVLFVVGCALGIIVAVYAVVYASSARLPAAKRYRPGRPFEFSPVWFLAQPEPLVARQESRRALPATPIALRKAAAGTKGGASGKW